MTRLLESNACLAGLLCLAALVFLVCGQCEESVTVPPLASNCSVPKVCEIRGGNNTIDQALKCAAKRANKVTLQLLPGCHCIQDYIPVWNTADITLAGMGSRDEVVITCADGVGLSFFNATRLTIHNVTMDGCGLTGKALTEFHSELNETIDFFFTVPERYSIALLCGLCTDFTLSDSTIMNSPGLGLLGVNVIGNSNLSNNYFTANGPMTCRNNFTLEGLKQDHIGGGAVFLFHDYLGSNNPGYQALNIKHSDFSSNSYCSSRPIYTLYSDQSPSANDAVSVLQGGGGLTIGMTQFHYSVNVVVDSCDFMNNSATFGSGAFVVYFSGVDNCHTLFRNCTLKKNGGDESAVVSGNISTLIFSAGIAFLKDVIRPDIDTTEQAYKQQVFPNSLTVANSTFYKNIAASASALFVGSVYSFIPEVEDYVLIDGCTFEENIGSGKAVIYVFERKLGGQQPGLRFQMNSVTFIQNYLHTLQDRIVGNPTDSASLISFSAMNASLSGNCVFKNNGGGVIRTVNSILHFYDNITFANNTGTFGAALRMLESSLLVVHNHSHIVFESNSAAVAGGAIFADYFGSTSSYIYYDCVLYFEEIDLLCVNLVDCTDITTLDVKIEFINNTAKSGGVMFGSTLDTCPWGIQLKMAWNITTEHIFDILYHNFSSLFYFSDSPTTVRVVSTSTKSIEAVFSLPTRVVGPGQVFHVNVTAEDHFGQQVPVLLTTFHTDTPIEERVLPQLGHSGYWFTGQNVTTPVSIGSHPNNSDVTVNLFATDSFAQASITVSISGCPPGFIFNNDTLRCDCTPLFEGTQVECSAETLMLSIPGLHWIGKLTDQDSDQDLVISACLYDYCDPRPGIKTLSPLEFDSQCHRGFNRVGLLCGSCDSNYSIGFSTDRCLECSGSAGLAWILFFAVVGILIIFMITFLRITVADGYLNGVLLYCNILAVYITAIFPGDPISYFFTPVLFLNLNLGIETCFYEGMSQLARVGLRFVFPAYLYVLMFAIIYIAKRSERFSRLFTGSGFSASKLFATLLVMTYSSVFETCAEVLSFVDVKTLSGVHSVRWRFDPKVVYFKGTHAFLGVFSFLLLLLYIIPFPIFLIFHRFAFRFRRVLILKPIFDAFGAPFKAKYQYWIGLRLLFRLVPLVLVGALTTPLNVFLLGCAMLFLLFFQVLAWPYEGFAVNTFDMFFISNIIAISFETLYLDVYRIQECTDNLRPCINIRHNVVGTQMSFAYIAILLVFLWHIVLRFQKLRHLLQAGYETVLQKLKFSQRTSANQAPSVTYGTLDAPSDDDMADDDNSSVPSAASTPNSSYGKGIYSHVKFDSLREPQLEESIYLTPNSQS